jgi:glycopeptide antibiotics resistance protein
MIELRIFSLVAVKGISPLIYAGLLTTFIIGTALSIWLKGFLEGLRYSAIILLAEWFLLLLSTCVLFREGGAEYHINLIPLSSYFDYGENSYFIEKAVLNLLNVALFIPIGFLLGCGFRNVTWKKALAIGAMLSVFIEILQLISRRGLCEVDDVMHNVVGCMIGYGIYMIIMLFYNIVVEK